MRWHFDPFSHVRKPPFGHWQKRKLMLPLLSLSVHKFRAGVAIRKTPGEEASRRAMIHFNPNVIAFTRWGLFQRSCFLNVAGQIRSVAIRMTTEWQRCTE